MFPIYVMDVDSLLVNTFRAIIDYQKDPYFHPPWSMGKPITDNIPCSGYRALSLT